MERMTENMQPGLAPRHHLAIEPDHPVAVVEGNAFHEILFRKKDFLPKVLALGIILGHICQ